MCDSEKMGYYYDTNGKVQYFCGLDGLYKEIAKVMGNDIVDRLKEYHDSKTYEAIMGLAEYNYDEESLETYIDSL